MADPFAAQSPELPSVADQLTEVSSKMSQILKKVEDANVGETNRVKPGEPVWDDDKPGGGFAGEPDGKRYLGQQGQVDAAVAAKVDLLNHYSDVLRQTADGAEAQDQS
jgi:hypothetical protein